MKTDTTIHASISDLSLPLQELMSAFEEEGKKTNRPRLMLTAAVSAGKGTIESGYQIAAIGALVFSLKCGGWGVRDGPHFREIFPALESIPDMFVHCCFTPVSWTTYM